MFTFDLENDIMLLDGRQVKTIPSSLSARDSKFIEK